MFRFADKIDVDYLAIDNFHRDETYRSTPTFRIDQDVHVNTLALSNITQRNQIGENITFMQYEGVIDRLNVMNISVSEELPISGSGKVAKFVTDGSCPWMNF